MREERVREAEVALAVLEVDGVHLVRHGGGADLARHDALPEVAHRNVLPGVAVEAKQHRIEARRRVEELRQPVVRLDLRRVRVIGQAEARLDERARRGGPVSARVGGEVRLEAARGAVELAERRHVAHLARLAREPEGEVRPLLAHGRRRRGLAVRARQHGHVRESLGRVRAARYEAEHRGQHDLAARLVDHERVGQVVHVLARAGKVQELGGRRELAHAGGRHGLLEKVLDGLDVVVRRRLDGLHARGARHVEARDDVVQRAQRRHRQRARPAAATVAAGAGAGVGASANPDAGSRDERLQPRDLDAHTRADQRVLREGAAQPRHGGHGRVAAVQARDGRQRREGQRRRRRRRRRRRERAKRLAPAPAAQKRPAAAAHDGAERLRPLLHCVSENNRARILGRSPIVIVFGPLSLALALSA